MNRMMLFDPAGAMRQGMEQGRQTRIGRLAGEAYNAPVADRQNALGLLASTDAGAAFSVEQGLGNQDDQRAQSLGNMARMYMATPEQMRPSLYQSRLLPQLRQMGIDAPEEYGPIVDETAAQLAQAFQDDSALPAGVRELQAKIAGAGLDAEEERRAYRVDLGLDGRASSAGYSLAKARGSDGRERLGVFNPRTGQIDMPDGTSFNPNTQQVAATVGESAAPLIGELSRQQQMPPQDQPPQARAPQPPQGRQFQSEQQRMEFEQMRASMENENGGPLNDRQLDMVYAMTTPAQPADAPQSAGMAPQRASGGDVYAQAPMGSGGVNPFVGRSAEEEAAAARRATLGVDLELTPQVEAARQRAQFETEERFRPPPAGFRRTADGQGFEPIPGSQQDVERQRFATAEEAKQENFARQGQTVVEDIGRALEMIEGYGRLAAGPAARFSPAGLDLPAERLENMLASVRSNIGVNELQAMRDASPTGGALGNVTERQLEGLQSLLGSMKATDNPVLLQDNLKRVSNIYSDLIHGPGEGPPRYRLGFDEGGRRIEGGREWGRGQQQEDPEFEDAMRRYLGGQ